MSIDFNTKCRTCLSESIAYYQLFDNIENYCNILEMLDCTVPQINIKCTSHFSNLVCQICVDKLLTCYKFQQMCIESNNRLHNLFEITVIEKEKANEMIADPLITEADQTVKKEIEQSTSIESEVQPKMLIEEVNIDDLFTDNRSKIDYSTSNAQTQLLLDELKHKDSAKRIVDIECKNLRLSLMFPCPNCPSTFETKTSLFDHYKVNKKNKSPKNKTEPLELEKAFDVPNILQEDPNYIIKEELKTILKEDCEKAHVETKVIDYADTGIGENKSPNRSENKYGLNCKICGKVFDRSSNLRRHMSVHSLARPHECKICKYRFADPKMFKAHMFQHKDEEGKNVSQFLPDGYKCEVCQRNFMSIKQLAKHFKNQHPEVEKHKCNYCNRQFILHDSLLKHINHRHKSNKSLVCEICERIFETTLRLRQHKRLHKSYLCPQCGKTFHGESNLLQHIKRHKGLQEHQCSECPKRFNCKSDLIKHSKSHSGAKPYVCDICGSRFTRNCSLLKHKRLHKAERPFKCDQCNMTFKLIGVLKRHMRTHTGEKPYKCKYCERAYAESGDLTKHLRTHVGENTYMCDQCPMAFKYQTELRQHQSQHYKMENKMCEGEGHHEKTKQNQEKQNIQ